MMRKLIVLICTMLIISAASTEVFADEDLRINKIIIESALLENGDLKISQDITYEFNDKYNGVYWNIGLKDTDGIRDVKVYELINGSAAEYIQQAEPNKGDYGLFKSTQTDDNLELMIFSPAKDETKTFRLEYVLKNVAIAHTDTGELYYKFIGDTNTERIDYFEATIQLPEINKDKVKIFAHGPLNGEIHFADNDSVKLQVSNVPSHTFIEARIFFPLDYIPASTNAGTNNLNSLMDKELAYAKNIEEKAAKSEQIKKSLNTVSVFLSVIGAALIYFFFKKFKRNPQIYQEMDSQVPDDISPAELKLTMSSFLDGRALIATLFDLSRRGFIRIDHSESDEEPKKGLFGGSKEPQENYSFTKTDRTGNLLPHESFFIDWIFNDIGQAQSVTTMDIDHYRKKQSSAFSKKYKQWNSLVKNDLKSRHYHDEKGKKYLVYLLIPYVLFLVLGIISIAAGAYIGILLIVMSQGMFLMSIAIATRKSDKGFIQHRLWKDFMKEMTAFEDADRDASRDKYLIAAIALGITMKKMNEYRENTAHGYYPMYWGGFYYGGLNKNGGSKFEDSLNRSFYGSAGTSTSTSASVGGGGGFSGGGGGGAGGGGGGGGF